MILVTESFSSHPAIWLSPKHSLPPTLPPPRQRQTAADRVTVLDRFLHPFRDLCSLFRTTPRAVHRVRARKEGTRP